VDEPQGDVWGGTVAAPIFKNIAKSILELEARMAKTNINQ
jgi:hypothetical protein